MPTTTSRDKDCAFLARAALFPLKINRDGSHPTQFPALEALNRIRQERMQAEPDKALSSVFPPRVVVVKSLEDDSLKINGHPDLHGASFEVIPKVLSVQCMECLGNNKAYTREKGKGEKEIVVCTNRVLQNDYHPETILDLPQKSLAAVEEALAHQVSRVGDQGKDGTCQGLAACEARAAMAAECYFSRDGKKVRRGSGLLLGYSKLPLSVQQRLKRSCIQAVATPIVQEEYGKEEGKKCLEVTLDKVLNGSS